MPITVPERLDGFDAELVAMIDQHVEAARAAPRDPQKRAMLARVYEANKLWPAAREAYVNATELQPDEPMWPHHAAIAWIETGDVEGAMPWLRCHAEKFPSFAPLQHRLGVVLLDVGELEGAEAAFGRAVSHARDKIPGYIGLGDVKLRAGKAAEAARILEKVVQQEPTDKTAHYLLGRAYRVMGRVEEAHRELTRGMGGKRRYVLDEWSASLSKYAVGAAGKQNLAAKLLSAGRFSEATEILKRLQAKQPENVDTLVNLGIAYLSLKRLEAARDVLLEAERLDDTRFEVFINLAACYRRLNRPADALRYADRTLGLAPEAAHGHYARGIALAELQRDEEARQAFSQAVSFDARSPSMRQALANTCARLGRFGEAATHYQTLARLLPVRWEPQLGIARMSLRLGRLDEAAWAIEAGLRLAPGEPSLLRLAQRLSQRQGE